MAHFLRHGVELKNKQGLLSIFYGSVRHLFLLGEIAFFRNLDFVLFRNPLPCAINLSKATVLSAKLKKNNEIKHARHDEKSLSTRRL